MGIGSKVNPNFPIPGLDQSSKGFRDNFAIIKREIEGIQGTTIQLIGGVVSDPVEIGDVGSIVIDTAINGNSFVISGPNNAVQFNASGTLTGDDRFVFDSDTGTVGIGTSVPDPFVKLDVDGRARFVESVNINQDSSLGTSYLSLFTTTGNLALINNGSSGQIGTITSTPFHLMTTSVNRLTVLPTGNVGIGSTMPATTLDVFSNTRDIARFKNSLPASENLIRVSTSQIGSSIGVGLEHTAANRFGGIRLNDTGTVSIHTGGFAGSTLSSSSARISIDNFGKVGIGSSIPSRVLDVNGNFNSTGITDNSDNVVFAVGINNRNPDYELDVAGNIARTQALVSTNPYLIVDTLPIVIDSWPAGTFRSARYTVQISNGLDPSEQIDIYDYAVMHANSTAIAQQFNYFSSGITPLGALSVNYSSGYVELIFTGVNDNNIVRLDKSYIIK
jgi:hypothetical protein